MPDQNDLDIKRKEKMAEAQAMSGAGDFLPNIVLAHGTSDATAEGKCNEGDFVCDNNNLGPEVRMVVITRRYHAYTTINKKKDLESFNPFSPLYAKITKSPRDYKQSLDSRYGISWLVYLPDHNLFAILHPNTPSARPVSRDIKLYWTPPEDRDAEAERTRPHTPLMLLKSKRANMGNYRPWVPYVEPIVEFDKSILPSSDEADFNIKRFQKPVQDEENLEAVPEDAPDR